MHILFTKWCLQIFCASNIPILNVEFTIIYIWEKQQILIVYAQKSCQLILWWSTNGLITTFLLLQQTMTTIMTQNQVEFEAFQSILHVESFITWPCFCDSVHIIQLNYFRIIVISACHWQCARLRQSEGTVGWGERSLPKGLHILMKQYNELCDLYNKECCFLL